MKRSIYLDYAATTPVAKEVVEKMQACLSFDANFGNPASNSHIYGWQAAEAVETAREQVAKLLAADVREIVFTSGATESDNLALFGAARAKTKTAAKKHIVSSSIEHKAVLDSLAQLEQEGFEISLLKPSEKGMTSVSAIADALTDDTCLVSIMHANNETGAINDIAAIGQLCRERDIVFHVDAAQSMGKLPINVRDMQIDLLSISAHKMYGPKGIGALFVSRQPKVDVEPLIFGGGHERGMRSGTLATHQIVGLGEACVLAEDNGEELARIERLRNKLWQGIRHLDYVSLNTDLDNALVGHLNVCFAGLEGETLLMSLRRLALSSGSACNSASMKPSYVLTEMGLSDQAADSSIRFSVGRYTSEEDIDEAIVHICDVCQRLAK